MKKLTELVLSLCDLVEAEGGVLRENVFRVTRAILLLVGALVAGLAALAFMVAAAYESLAGLMSKPAALALMGAACAVMAIILILGAAWMQPRKKTAAKAKK